MKFSINEKEVYKVSALVSKLIIEMPTGNVDVNIPVGYQNINMTIVAKDMVAAPLDAVGHPTFVPKELITEDVAKELSILSSIVNVEARDKKNEVSKLAEIVSKPGLDALAVLADQEQRRKDKAAAEQVIEKVVEEVVEKVVEEVVVVEGMIR